jgi:hypothetical protein
MADTSRIVRSLFTVSLDLTGAATFDFANQQPVALAQSYSLDTVVNTQNLVANDLADPAGAAEWNFPEPTDKSWTVTVDNLYLLDDAVNPNYDPTGKTAPAPVLDALKAGTRVWVAGADSDATTGATVPWYGQGLITTYNQAGTIDEYHTYSMTVTGQGEIQTALLLT